MYPLLDMIIDDMPAPEVDENAPLAMQCVTIDHPTSSVASVSAACIPAPSTRGPDSGCEERRLQRHRYRQSSSSLPSTTWAAPSARKSAPATSPPSWASTAPISAMSTPIPRTPSSSSPSRSTRRPCPSSSRLRPPARRSRRRHRGRPSAQGEPVQRGREQRDHEDRGALEDKSGVEVSGAASCTCPNPDGVHAPRGL